jgi:hypothetical protein
MEHELNIFESKHIKNENPFNEKRLRSYGQSLIYNSLYYYSIPVFILSGGSL